MRGLASILKQSFLFSLSHPLFLSHTSSLLLSHLSELVRMFVHLNGENMNCRSLKNESGIDKEKRNIRKVRKVENFHFILFCPKSFALISWTSPLPACQLSFMKRIKNQEKVGHNFENQKTGPAVRKETAEISPRADILETKTFCPQKVNMWINNTKLF